MIRKLLSLLWVASALLSADNLSAQTVTVSDATGVQTTVTTQQSNALSPIKKSTGRLSRVALPGCPVITCPGTTTTVADSASCGTVVTFSTPTATDLCALTSDTITYTGSIVTWTVPAGITSVHIEAAGAQGGWNTSSSTAPGLGAMMSGDFAVTPGQQLKILVGQQPSNGSGNGGGGGTFVTDNANTPLIVAGGGGGSSQSADSPDKHGQITTTGGTGAGGGGAGGSGGNGGNIGASGFQSGAGGGLLTNGADGWTAGTGGLAFVNGGSGGTANAPANGGFGGGGSGSSYVVGGGGGGYSGGGSGGNSTAGVGGGGGSYNAGTNQSNTGGVNTGNGYVVITYYGGTVLTVTQIAGLPSGSLFPAGTTVQTFVATNSNGDADTCSFTITVNDTTVPAITSCSGNITVNADSGMCSATVTFPSPAGVDNCSTTVLQTSGLPSGSAFPVGTTPVTFTVSDAAGNSSSCSFDVIVTDDESPVINCMPPLTVNTDSGLCTAVVNFSLPSATDNCSGVTVTQISGPVSGSTLPIGLTYVGFMATDAAGNTSTCTMDITVADGEGPTVTCSNNITTCEGATTLITANAQDACSGVSTLTYTLSGATTGSGPASDFVVFNTGTTTVTYTATDSAGNSSSCSFMVTANANPAVTVSAGSNTPCVTDAPVTLTGTPAGGTWSGTAVSGSTFNPATAGNGSYVLTYLYADGNGCQAFDSLTIVVDPCTGTEEHNSLPAMQIAPNPSSGNLTVSLGRNYADVMITLTTVNGQTVRRDNYNNTTTATVDLTAVASGIYFLTVQADGEVKTVKVIRE